MNKTQKETSKQPVQKFQLRGISASVFENQSENGVPFYKVSITRTYKADGEFKTATTFSRDDLPLVEVLTRQAWLSILKREAESTKKSDS